MRIGNIIMNDQGETGILMKIEDELGQYSYTFECSNPNPDLHVCVRYGVDAVWSFNECRTLPVTGRTAKCGMR
jgi:hypothetical protein